MKKSSSPHAQELSTLTTRFRPKKRFSLLRRKDDTAQDSAQDSLGQREHKEMKMHEKEKESKISSVFSLSR